MSVENAKAQGQGPKGLGLGHSDEDGRSEGQGGNEVAPSPALRSDPGASSDTPRSLIPAAHAEARTSPEPIQLVPLDLGRIFRDDGDTDPDYLVGEMFARGTVTLLSGDTGAGKSWLGLSLALAVAHGTSWLGETARPGPVVVVDEENPAHVVFGRLRALGAVPEDVGRLFYMSRHGLLVGDSAAPLMGDGGTDSALSAFLGEHCPSLVIIDTALAATAITSAEDNAAVVALFKGLRGLAEQHDCAVVLLHHERKGTAGGSSEDALGARAWVGQADAQLSLKKGRQGREDDGEGCTRLWTEATLRFWKTRDDVQPAPWGVRIESLKEDGRLIDAEVVRDDSAATACDSESGVSTADALADAIVNVLAETGKPMKRAEIAQALDDPPATTLTSAFKALREAGRVTQPAARGPYALAAPGEPAI